MQPIYLGIDLGGSNISAVLLDAAGQTIQFKKIETLAAQGPKKVIQRIVDLSRQIQTEANVSDRQLIAVGIGVPGVLDLGRGMVVFSPNLPGWKNIPLGKLLSAQIHKPIVIDNDANVAALGEKLFGAGRNSDFVVVYTLGTGVGGGIIIDGKIYHGAKDGAGELGHTTILPDGPPCGCGNIGCLEALVSGTAIARRGREAMASGQPTLMRELAQGRPENLTAKLVFEAAKKGDLEALRLVRETGQYLGIAVANVINLLDPERVIIGGGVAVAGEILMRAVREEVRRRAMKALLKHVKIVRAQLSDRAGVIGAAGAAMQAFPAKRKRLKSGA